MRRHLSTVLIVLVTVAITAVAPAVAETIADYAKNAGKVDDRSAVGAGATIAKRSGKLVATDAEGRLPDNIIRKAPDSERLDGLSKNAFVRPSELLSVRPLHFVGDTAAEVPIGGTCTNYAGLAVTVYAPGPGDIEVSGVVQIEFAPQNTVVSRAIVNIASDTADCAGDAGGARVWNPKTVDDQLLYSTLPLTRTYSIPSAGSYTYYVNGNGQDAEFYYGRLNATFFPAG